jgi:hypothetical protein
MEPITLPSKIGEAVLFSANGRDYRVKKLSRSTWFLHDLAITERGRFGTKAEITEDITLILEGNGLPRSKSPRMW